MDLLRFITAGSVDDGKSTLIGRLLYDSNAVSSDILTTIERQSKNNVDGSIDLSLLTDGLRSERSQGITIDVAYKYFTSTKRKFIIADAPGHVQYTRNMITGCSNADLAIILIDARQGIVEQTRRHSAIISLLQVPHLTVCINKMDLVDFSEDVFLNISAQFQSLAKNFTFKDITFIPISAYLGDNVVSKSKNTAWYAGKTLLEHLESVEVRNDVNLIDARFQVQYVIRPLSKEYHDYRGFAGRIQSGVYKVGDEVTIYPTGTTSTISAIEIHQKQVVEAYAGQSVVLHLSDDVEVERGYSIIPTSTKVAHSNEIEATLCITDASHFAVGSKLLLKHNAQTLKAIIKEIPYRIDIQTFDEIINPDTIGLNDLVRVKIKTDKALTFDKYAENRKTGAFILINDNTNQTVAAGLIEN